MTDKATEIEEAIFEIISNPVILLWIITMAVVIGLMLDII